MLRTVYNGHKIPFRAFNTLLCDNGEDIQVENNVKKINHFFLDKYAFLYYLSIIK